MKTRKVDTCAELSDMECCQEGAMNLSNAHADAPDIFHDPASWENRQGHGDNRPESLGVVMALITVAAVSLASLLVLVW